MQQKVLFAPFFALMSVMCLIPSTCAVNIIGTEIKFLFWAEFNAIKNSKKLVKEFLQWIYDFNWASKEEEKFLILSFNNVPKLCDFSLQYIYMYFILGTVRGWVSTSRIRLQPWNLWIGTIIILNIYWILIVNLYWSDLDMSQLI